MNNAGDGINKESRPGLIRTALIKLNMKQIIVS